MLQTPRRQVLWMVPQIHSLWLRGNPAWAGIQQPQHKQPCIHKASRSTHLAAA
jgi:hypothetical protein